MLINKKNLQLIALQSITLLFAATEMPIAQDRTESAEEKKAISDVEADALIAKTLLEIKNSISDEVEAEKAFQAAAEAPDKDLKTAEKVAPQPDVAPKQASTTRTLVDKILVRVDGANILMSDLKKPQLSKSGETYSLDELIEERLLINHAQKRGITVTDEVINRQIASVKADGGIQHLSDSEFEQELKKQGFTLKEYKNQLGVLHLTRSVVNAEVSEKTIVTKQEIEKYYADHPVTTKERYKIQICTIPLEHEEKYKDFLEQKNAPWESLGWIELKDLGQPFAEIKSLAKDTVSQLADAADGSKFVFKYSDYKEPRVKTLSERYSSIEKYLQSQRKETVVGDFLSRLKEQATIEYLD